MYRTPQKFPVMRLFSHVTLRVIPPWEKKCDIYYKLDFNIKNFRCTTAIIYMTQSFTFFTYTESKSYILKILYSLITLLFKTFNIITNNTLHHPSASKDAHRSIQ